MSSCDELDIGLERKLSFPARPCEIGSWHGNKLMFDRCIAVVLLILGLPLIGILAALVRITSSGPAIFRQERVGKDGRRFTIFKLRTMESNAEATCGPVWSPADDSRVTAFGKWLRKRHLDELPQLFNVVQGDMSLIGPRPERPEFVEMLSDLVPNFGQRLAVLPGITGLAQINLAPDVDLDSVRRKLVLDQEYVRDASVVLDVRILLASALRIIGIPGVWAASIALVERQVTLESSPAITASNSAGSTELTVDRIAAESENYSFTEWAAGEASN